jgi:pimeloyl-ACP methyl ester carboxylesterase
MRTPKLRRVARAAGELAVADYPGTEPAIVIMHGFPDRRSINEPLARQLEGRRVLLFDFLGYGGSDKPAGHSYDAASFEDDLDAVVSELTDGPVVIVGHDASGPTAINWVQRNPKRTEHLVLLNCYYHQTPSLGFPEVIALFADPATRPLTTEIAADQDLMLLGFLWQGAAFAKAAQGAPSIADSARRRGKPRWLAAFPLRELCRLVGLSPRKIRIGVRLLRKMAKWRFVPTAEQLRWIPAPEPGVEHRPDRFTEVVCLSRNRRFRPTRPIYQARARGGDRGAVSNQQLAAPRGRPLGAARTAGAPGRDHKRPDAYIPLRNRTPRLTAVLARAVSWVMSRLARLARERFRCDQTDSTGLSWRHRAGAGTP